MEYGHSRILLEPAIPVGAKATVKIKKGDNLKSWYVGITKEDPEKTKTVWLGAKKNDWSYGSSGYKGHNNS